MKRAVEKDPGSRKAKRGKTSRACEISPNEIRAKSPGRPKPSKQLNLDIRAISDFVASTQTDIAKSQRQNKTIVLSTKIACAAKLASSAGRPPTVSSYNYCDADNSNGSLRKSDALEAKTLEEAPLGDNVDLGSWKQGLMVLAVALSFSAFFMLLPGLNREIRWTLWPLFSSSIWLAGKLLMGF